MREKLTWHEQLGKIQKELKPAPLSKVYDPINLKSNGSVNSSDTDNKNVLDKIAQTTLGVSHENKTVVSKKSRQVRKANKKISANKDYSAAITTYALINSKPPEKGKAKATDKIDKYSLAPFAEMVIENFTDRVCLNHVVDKPLNMRCFESHSHEIDPPNSITRDLFIGLDFGTAFTKVIIGDGVNSFYVSLSKRGDLLPSKIYVKDSGECSLRETVRSVEVNNLKLPLIMQEAKDIDRAAIICFLALVFKECRRWVNTSKYQQDQITWFVNAGLPTESYAHQELKSEYTKLIGLAWQLSYPSKVFFQNALHAISNMSALTLPKLQSEQISLFPEFAAQIQGYVRSPQRQPHSHFMVDIGAGTLDVSRFLIKVESEEIVFDIYGRCVERLGVDMLSLHRMYHSGVIRELKDLSMADSAEALAEMLDIEVSEIKEIDIPFRKAVNRSIRDVFMPLVSNPDTPLVEPATFFICGGGQHVELFKEAMAPLLRDFRSKINVLALPKPDNLELQKGALIDYHRLSVAYGLAYDPFNIGNAIEKIDHFSVEASGTVERQRDKLCRWYMSYD